MGSFYFYDVETSGFNPREARVMQFAGQRTDMDLQPIDQPHNFFIQMSDDVVPDPDAVLITGITPQQTMTDGITEAEFLKIFHKEIAIPDTIFVGYNTIRFDDEFMRYLHYRNFYDPYEWHYKDGRGRWDLLDPVRMMRALRPEGIKWPMDVKGKPTNRLGLLTSINKLTHEDAHSALGDVMATLELARLLKSKQPDLFRYLLKLRTKEEVKKFVETNKLFVYTSGKYASEFEKTTVVSVLAPNPNRSGVVLVFDLRYDPSEFASFSPAEMVEAWRRRKDDPGPRLPVKTMQFNRAPAIAPLGVLDHESEKRIGVTSALAQDNYAKLQSVKEELSGKVLAALQTMDKLQQETLFSDVQDVDTQLYEGFFDNEDRSKMSVVRAASVDELAGLSASFKDGRLNSLLPLYKARNFPKVLSDEERAVWERFRERKLLGGGTESRMARFFGRLGELEGRKDLTSEQQYLLQELQLYAQSIMPEPV